MARNISEKILLTAKGALMGAADVVPGVSGGTIAFITGIYEELVSSIRDVSLAITGNLIKGDLKGFWAKVNFSFFIYLFAGLGLSAILLSKVILLLLERNPVPLWSFFFGLIIASAVVVWKSIKEHSTSVFISGFIGIAIAYYITILVPAQTSEANWFIFLSGFIAICAMILPGISGSFILLLMGKYQFILSSISEFKLEVIFFFGTGAVSGLLVFSHVLTWLLKKYHDLTVALLAGFMIGSLNKVWPWKHTVSYYTNSKGAVHPLIQDNVLPDSFRVLTGMEPQLALALLLAAFGFAIVLLIEKFASDPE